MTEHPQLITKSLALSSLLAKARRNHQTIGLVPTMGNLHAGHLALIDRARREADLVVVAIFVNPRQFSEKEDFDRYPRTLETDLATVSGHGVAAVFAPELDEVYPPGNPPEVISAGALGDVYEGKARPGHFDGVLTVCHRLFSLTGAAVAVFGEKDAQQLFLIRSMVVQRSLPVRIVSVPTVRDTDGLALSSRNQFLSPAERRVALALPHTLHQVAQQVSSGHDMARALEHGRELLANVPGMVLDYVDIVCAETFQPDPQCTGEQIIIAAVKVGTTRLIDNVRVAPGHPPSAQ